MTAGSAQPVMRRSEIEPVGTRKAEPVTSEHRERAPHIDTLIQLVSVRVVRVADLILRIGKITFGNRFGVKPTDLRILIILGAHQPISVNEVSRRTHVDKAWISRSLGALSRRKLIKKTAHPADSRASSLSLTKKGETLLRQIAPVAEQYQRELLRGQSKSEVERVLDLLAERAEEMYQQTVSDNRQRRGKPPAGKATRL
jgi:DNA-binding MarR family transcriptional regulator